MTAKPAKNSGKHKVDGNVRGLAFDDNVLTVSTDSGNIYAFSSRRLGRSSRQLARALLAPFPEDELTEFYKSAARQILQNSDQRTGYCLVLGSERGRLAYELAQQSELMIYAVEPDAEKAAASRESTRPGRHPCDANHGGQCADR